MTGQCKLCNQLITPPASGMADPTGLLSIRWFADAIHNHCMMWHPDLLKQIQGINRMTEARLLAQFTRSSSEAYTVKLKTLSDVLIANLQDLDVKLGEDDVTLRPVPEEQAPTGFREIDENTRGVLDV